MSDSENQSSIVSFTTGLGGDVDLSVGNKIYRVQRDILSDKSEIFAGLFAKALLEVHGSDHKSPVIPLPEKSQPFELFLRAIYEHDLDTCLPKYARDTTKIIADILDIATRYTVAKALFLEKFTPFIVRDWPDTLDGWDAIESYAAQLRETIEETHQCPAENDELPEPASAIHFACLYAEGDALPSYVPAAFYQLARTPILGDLDAIATSEWDFNGGRTAKFWILTPRVMLCLHHGTNNLRRLTAEIAFRGFVSAAEGDLNASQDEKAAMIEWWRNIGIKQLSGHYRAYWPVLDPLTDLKDLADLLVNDSVEEPPGFYESDSDSDPHCEFVDDSGDDSDDELRGKAWRTKQHIRYEGVRMSIGSAYRGRMHSWLQEQRQILWTGLSETFYLSQLFLGGKEDDDTVKKITTWNTTRRFY